MVDSPTGGSGAHWQLTLLGAVRAESRSMAVTRWPSRAAAALLARLALAPQRDHAREELVELLWPGVAPDVGRPRLRQVLSTLRALLETADTARDGVIVADRQSLRLVPGALGCDVLQFERFVQAGDAAAAREVYSGDFMPGHYDDWIVAERHRLSALAEGLPAAVDTPSTTASAAPVAPDTAAPPTAAAAAPSGLAPHGPALPSYWSRAFGQAEILQQLQAALHGRRLLTVLGPGGSGKTRLAVALAAARQAAGHAACFVSLAETTDAAGFWRSLAQALAPPQALPGDSRPEALIAALNPRPMLLVLDNVEQLEGSAVSAIAQLLTATQRLQLLATSRRRLGLDGEALFDMQALPLPATGATAAEAAQSAAVALFVDRARALRADFHLTAANTGAVVGLVNLLEGRPLAIELAASRSRGHSPAELLAQLQGSEGSPMLDLLARPGLRTGGPARHASMRQVLAWSWRQLDPPLRQLLQTLSVPGESLSLDLATALASGLALPSGPALTVQLDEAVETGLLSRVSAADDLPLFRLPPPVREYAAEMRPPSLARQVRQLHRQWLAEQAAARLPAGRAALWPELAHLSPLLLQAAADDDLLAALRLALAARGEWAAGALPPDLTQALEAAVRAGAQAGQAALASAGHDMLALLRHYRGQKAEALADAEAALALAPDDWHRAAALQTACTVRVLSSETLAPVESLLDQAEQLARRSGNLRVLALALRLRGAIAINYRSDFATAEAMATECRALHAAAGDQLQERSSQVDIAVCWAWRGREAAAAAWLETAFAAWRRDPPSLPLISGLCQLGRIQLRREQGVAAEQAFRESIQLARAGRWHSVVRRALMWLPEAWALQGRWREAALLHGYACAELQRHQIAVGPAEAPEGVRLRQRLDQGLGADVAAELLQAGAMLDAEAADQLLLARDAEGAAVSAVAVAVTGAGTG